MVEWLSAGAAFIAFWLYLLRGDLIQVTPDNQIHLFLIPVYFVIIFGLISAVIVIYRTFNFNDCPEAYEELKQEIQEARHHLETKGFKFKSQE